MMLPSNNIRKTRILILSMALAASGCDERAIEIAREASDRQAAQNRQMAELQKEVAGGTHELLKSDAAARTEFAGVHRDLQQERRQLSESWTDLELERRRVDQRRHSSSNWQATLAVLVVAGLVTALLAFIWQLLTQARSIEPRGDELNELLLQYFLPPITNSKVLLSETPDTQHPDLALDASHVSHSIRSLSSNLKGLNDD